MKKPLIFIGVAALLALVVSCASNPYSDTNRVHKLQAKAYTEQLLNFPPRQGLADSLNYGENWVGTTNFSLRRPNYVIIHHTAQHSVEQTLKTFTLPRTSVSSHYVISEEGVVYQMLNDYYRGWHAGDGKWGHNTDLNSSSIGIELDNNGYEPFAEKQIESLLDLLEVLKERHGIPTANFIGHADIAPTRKVDPNVNFPWEKLAEEGFGYWYDEIEVTPKVVGDSLSTGDQNNSEERSLLVTENEIRVGGSPSDTLTLVMNPEIALRLIGYDTRDLEAAIRAFKLHFIQKDINAVLTEDDLKILYNLARKYM